MLLTCLVGLADVLVKDITPAKLCPFLDFNINSELGRFKSSAKGDAIHNGAPVNLGLLNEKWEALALLPVNGGQDKDCDDNDEYYLIALSDNDFITDNGKFSTGPEQWGRRLIVMWQDTPTLAMSASRIRRLLCHS